MPLVSVVMPSYNHEKFISETIESVLSQTAEDLELIIIDDASKDRSKQIIERYKEKDNRIKAIYHDKNMGIARTFNDGIESAKGKFISLIASDDIWNDNKLEKQLNILKRNENLVVWSEGEIVNGESYPTGEFFTQIYKSNDKSGYLFETLLKINFIFISSAIFKRANIKSIKFNETMKYLNDHQFFTDLAFKYEYQFIEEPLAKYRLHGDNSIFSNKKDWYNDSVLLNKYCLQKYGKDLSNKTKISTSYTISRTLLYNAINPKFWNKNLIYVIIPLIQLNALLIKDFSYNIIQKTRNR